MPKRMLHQILALVLVACIGHTSNAADLGKLIPNAQPVSLFRLLAAPHEYVGKTISVAGIFSWGFEDELLFLSSDHFAMYDESSAVRLSLDEAASGVRYSDLESFSGYRVKLEGVILEEQRYKALVEAAEEAGYTVRPIYYLRFSRLRSYGPALDKKISIQHPRASER